MSSEIQESAGFYDVLAWFEVNRKQVTIGIAAIAVLALLISYVVWNRNQKEIAANKALIGLAMNQTSDESPRVVPAADYLKVAEEYAGTSAGFRAYLLAAGSYFGDGKYAEALAQFKQFSSRYGSGPLASLAEIGIAACHESMGNNDEAEKAYQGLLDHYPGQPVAVQSRLALGRIYEAKKQPERALQAYDDVLREKNRTAWSTEATERRLKLLALFPQLAKTNAPAAGTNVTGFLKATTQVTVSNSTPSTGAVPSTAVSSGGKSGAKATNSGVATATKSPATTATNTAKP